MCTPQSGQLRDVHGVIQRRGGRKETEVARRIKGGNQKGSDPAGNQFPKCSPPSGTHRDSQSWVERRRVREEQR